MTLRSYLILMGAATIVSWSVVALLVSTTDPASAPWVTFAILYACVFLAVTGTFSVIGFTARVLILRKQFQLSREVAISFRQSLLLATFIVAALLLSSHHLLSWWTGILLAALITFLESFFIGGRRQRE